MNSLSWNPREKRVPEDRSTVPNAAEISERMINEKSPLDIAIRLLLVTTKLSGFCRLIDRKASLQDVQEPRMVKK